MERKRKKGINIRIYLIAYIFVILTVSIMAAGSIAALLEQFVGDSILIPTFLLLLIMSCIFGTGATALLSQKILSPMTRLSSAMSRVAQGDFTVRLDAGGRINEIRNTYENFNLMVRELAATETLQSDFISNVSHEFKTPINAIEGYAMLLQDPGMPPEEQQEYLGKILGSTRRLSGLVGNILLLSRVDNQAIQAGRRLYRLDEQIRQAVVSLERAWSEKDVEFDVDMEPLVFYGNESLMFHVWTNLIGNAIKFDPYGGLIRIRLKQDGGSAVFEIEDNGPGIDQEEQKYIFDKFYQADNSHKEEGNGLGLALVRQILDACGGKISVRSLPDCGSVFTVRLPL